MGPNTRVGGTPFPGTRGSLPPLARKGQRQRGLRWRAAIALTVEAERPCCILRWQHSGTTGTDAYRAARFVATAVLTGAYQLGPARNGVARVVDMVKGSPPLRSVAVDWFGDYRPGRWVWSLIQVEPLNPPQLVRGQQRMVSRRNGSSAG